MKKLACLALLFLGVSSSAFARHWDRTFENNARQTFTIQLVNGHAELSAANDRASCDNEYEYCWVLKGGIVNIVYTTDQGEPKGALFFEKYNGGEGKVTWNGNIDVSPDNNIREIFDLPVTHGGVVLFNMKCDGHRETGNFCALESYAD